MKYLKTALLLLSISILFACHNKQAANGSTFELSGKLSGGGEGIPIYLIRITKDSEQALDSCKLGADGSFAFHTKGIYKGFYLLRLTKEDFATLILDSNEKVQLVGNAQFLGDTYAVNGSEDSKLFCDLNTISKMSYMARDSVQKVYTNLMNLAGGNKKKLDSINDAAEGPYDTLVNREVRYLKAFISKNPGSFACIAATEHLKEELQNDDSCLPYYRMVDKTLESKYPNSFYVRIFHNDAQNMERVAIGNMAPEITLPDTSGNTVTLSSFKGKVVLIDFWASWCGPCRASLPHVVEIYKKYKDKGFTVLSVSLDKDKDHWVDAIHKFKLTWTQVSDLKYWDSKVVSLYNFSSIPHTVLVSPDGKIIAKDLSETAMDEEIGKLVNDKKI